MHDCRPGAASLATKIAWPNAMQFFSYGDMLKDSVFVLPLQDLPERWKWIIAVTSEIDHGMLQWVWAEMDYLLDICQVATGEHIEHLQVLKNGEFLFPSVGHILRFCLPFKCTYFMKSVRDLWINLYIVSLWICQKLLFLKLQMVTSCVLKTTNMEIIEILRLYRRNKSVIEFSGIVYSYCFT
jgi:hypothetical protein